MRQSFGILAVLLALTVTVAMAQDSSGVRQLQSQIQVRVDVPGVDSTEWLAADIRYDTERCQLVQLRTVGWQYGQSYRGSSIPQNDRALLKRRSVREIQTRTDDTDPWVSVDIQWFKRYQGPTC